MESAERRNSSLTNETENAQMNCESVSLADSVAEAVESMSRKLKSGTLKPTVAEFVRLLELQKELLSENVKHIKVTWVDSLNGTEFTSET